MMSKKEYFKKKQNGGIRYRQFRNKKFCYKRRFGTVAMTGIAVCLCLAGCGVEDKALTFTVSGESESSPTVSPAQERQQMSQEHKDEMIYVHVCGAVVSPGVVKVASGSRVATVVEAAGGFTDEAQEDYVNLASRVEDGQQIFFPTKEEAAQLKEEAKAREQALQQTQSGIVNINTADIELLCTLPGIGEARARDIINYREQNGSFTCKEDIMQVPGIKENAYEKLCDRIVAD